MTPIEFHCSGTLKPDGTLELDSVPALAPGRVEVILRSSVPAATPTPREGWWEIAERIWADQAVRGHIPRTKEQIDADLESLRSDAGEWNDELVQIRELARQEREAKEAPQC
jgi:hypothetical protein